MKVDGDRMPVLGPLECTSWEMETFLGYVNSSSADSIKRNERNERRSAASQIDVDSLSEALGKGNERQWGEAIRGWRDI